MTCGSGFHRNFPQGYKFNVLQIHFLKYSILVHHESFKTFIRTKLFFSLCIIQDNRDHKSFGRLSSEAELLFPQPTFGPVTCFKMKKSSKNRLLHDDSDRLKEKTNMDKHYKEGCEALQHSTPGYPPLLFLYFPLS